MFVNLGIIVGFCILSGPLHQMGEGSETSKIIVKQKGEDWNYAKPGEYPWVVSIQEDTEGFAHMCGGSLATAKIVLTACHCIAIRPFFQPDEPFVYMEHRDKVVVAGSVINYRNDTVKKIVSRIASYKAHPGCRHFMHDHSEGADDIGGWDNDYGLITLSSKLPIDGKNVAPFKLYSTNPFKLRKELMRRMAIRGDCVVVGWGRRVALSSMDLEKLQNNTRKHSKAATDRLKLFWPTLTSIKVMLVDFATCYNIMCKFDACYCPVDHWSRKHMCATSLGRMEACEGDSGGPLMCGREKFLFGVVGWGPSCGKYKVPTMYPTLHGGWDFISSALNISNKSTFLDGTRSSRTITNKCPKLWTGTFFITINLFSTAIINIRP